MFYRNLFKKEKMNLREKMRTCGVSLKEVANAVPEANHTAVCHILNQDMAQKVLEEAEKLCQEKARNLKSSLEQI